MAMMTDHWQVIEDALTEKRRQCGRYIHDAFGRLVWTPDVYRIADVDASLAFVREQRQLAAHPPKEEFHP
jgi:hypothetical protein